MFQEMLFVYILPRILRCSLSNNATKVKSQQDAKIATFQNAMNFIESYLRNVINSL